MVLGTVVIDLELSQEVSFCMNEKIKEFLKRAETALADSMVEELSDQGKFNACYDAAAYCALAVAEAKGEDLHDVEWSSVLSYLSGQGTISNVIAHSATTLSKIYADRQPGHSPSESRTDVATARMCAIHIQRAVTAWLLQTHSSLVMDGGTRSRPSILALDLEGTLISSAVSQIPRPGLFEFLSTCCELFPRVVMFTTVNESRFREIARRLVEENFAPGWFSNIEYVVWQGETKDLGFIPNADPSDALLVDDFERYVHPGQESQWMQVEYFGNPYPAEDTGLLKLVRALQARLSGLPAIHSSPREGKSSR